MPHHSYTFLSNHKPNSNPLAAFSVLPPGVRFGTQDVDEDIILLLRKHPITNLPWIFLSLLMIGAPLVIFPLLDLGNITTFINSISVGIIPVLIVFWYVAISGYVLLNFFFWYFNINIVTNERILDFDFLYLLYREFSETFLKSVEEVTARSGGLMSTIFDYGTVVVHTAGPSENIEFVHIPKPQEVVRIINRLVEQAHQDV